MTLPSVEATVPLPTVDTVSAYSGTKATLVASSVIAASSAFRLCARANKVTGRLDVTLNRQLPLTCPEVVGGMMMVGLLSQGCVSSVMSRNKLASASSFALALAVTLTTNVVVPPGEAKVQATVESLSGGGHA